MLLRLSPPTPPVDRPLWQYVPGKALYLSQNTTGHFARETTRAISHGQAPERELGYPFHYDPVRRALSLRFTWNNLVEISPASLAELIRVQERHANPIRYYQGEQVELTDSFSPDHQLHNCSLSCSPGTCVEYLHMTVCRASSLPQVDVISCDSPMTALDRLEATSAIWQSGSRIEQLSAPVIYVTGTGLAELDIGECSHLLHCTVQHQDSRELDLLPALQLSGLTVPLVTLVTMKIIQGGYLLGTIILGYTYRHYYYTGSGYQRLTAKTPVTQPVMVYLPGMQRRPLAQLPLELWRIEIAGDTNAEKGSSPRLPPVYKEVARYAMGSTGDVWIRYRRFRAKSARQKIDLVV